MKIGSSISSCRHCQFYAPEGRRGGFCKKLNVSVKGHWNACNFATPPFARAWKELESIALRQQQVALQEQARIVVEGTLSNDLFEISPIVAVPVMLTNTSAS